MDKKDILINNNVDVNASLEFWGDIDSYNDGLKEFKDSLLDKLNTLEYYKNSSDFTNYGILAHSIKSEAKYLGFSEYAEVFLSHEMAGKESNKDFIDSNFDNLKDTINKIVNILDEYFNTEISHKKNILIADDSNIMLNYIGSNISDEYQVIKANNGKEAISALENNNIYAILLDLNMPSMNGFEVLDYLKQNELIEKIPVIIITGDDTEDTIKKAFTYPILDVLNKPFTIDKIERALVSINSFYEQR